MVAKEEGELQFFHHHKNLLDYALHAGETVI